MSSLCKYRHALGVPGQGFHSVRLFNVAILDVLATFAGALAVERIAGWLTRSKFTWRRYGITVTVAFVLGIFLHWLFCVPTTVQKFLFE